MEHDYLERAKNRSNGNPDDVQMAQAFALIDIAASLRILAERGVYIYTEAQP